jgi:hypothetical protein
LQGSLNLESVTVFVKSTSEKYFSLEAKQYLVFIGIKVGLSSAIMRSISLYSVLHFFVNPIMVMDHCKEHFENSWNTMSLFCIGNIFKVRPVLIDNPFKYSCLKINKINTNFLLVIGIIFVDLNYLIQLSSKSRRVISLPYMFKSIK